MKGDIVLKLIIGLVISLGIFALPALAQACGAVNLQISKSGPAAVKAGEVIVYTVTVTQQGSGRPTQVKVFDSIPAGLVFNALASSPQCGQQGSHVVCTPPGGQISGGTNGNNDDDDDDDNKKVRSVTFTIAFNVPGSPSQCLIQNAASVLAAEQTGGKTSNTVSTVIENCGVTPTPSPTPSPTPTPTPCPCTTSTPAVTPCPCVTATPTPAPAASQIIVNVTTGSNSNSNTNSNDSDNDVSVTTGSVNVSTGSLNQTVSQAPIVIPSGRVAGAYTTVAYNGGPVSVPITAQTGAGPLALLSTIMGGASLRFIKRHWW